MSAKRILNLSTTAVVIQVLLPAAAIGAPVNFDYYVWGGFDAVVNAFQKLALIFGDDGYKSFYFVSVTAGIFFGGLAMVAKMLGTGNGSVQGWLVPALIGIMVYLALILPKATLTIYDPVYNKSQAVGSLPQGVVVVAGVLNSLERGLVDIVATAGDPLSYQSQAGGKGFLGLAQLTSLPLSAIDTNIDTSMRNYIKDCVTFALSNPTAGLTVDQLRNQSTSFTADLVKAQNPAVWTVYYDPANPAGVPKTCTSAWTSINTALTTASLADNINAVCANIGYDPATAASMTQCKTVLNNVNTGTGLGAASIDDFIKQAYIAQRLDEVYRSGDSTGATNYQFLLNASGTMKSANEWLPILKAAMTAIAVGLLPFLALLIPTPLVGKALGTILGFFVWLTAWGVTDAVIHQFAVDFANQAYTMIRQKKLGMDALYMFPDQTVKILGMFGTLRLSGMMLATVITGTLVKFGGHAMAMMSGGLAGQIGQAGGYGSHTVDDPTGRASAEKSNTNSIPTQSWSNEFAYKSRQSQSGIEMNANTMASQDMVSNFGQEYSQQMMANGTVGRNVGYGAAGTAMKQMQGGLSEAYGLKAFDAKIGMSKSASVRDMVNNEYGGDLKNFAEMSVANDKALARAFGSGANYADYLSTNYDKGRGQIQGEVAAMNAAKNIGFKGDWRHFNSMRSEVSSLGDYASASAINEMAGRYGVTPGQLMQMNAQFQQGKLAGEVTGLSEQFGTASDAGTAVGMVAAAGTGGQIAGIYAAGGLGSYHKMQSGGVEGQMARNDLVRQAADMMVTDGKILQGIKNDPEYFSNGHLTENGFAMAQKAMQGQNISFSTPDGANTLNLDANGNIVNSSNRGAFAPGDADSRSQALQAARDIAHHDPNAAAKIRSMVKSGTPFSYAVENDKNGKTASFSFTHGGTASTIDNADNQQMRTSLTGNRQIAEDTKISTTKSYAEVDKTVSSQTDADRINANLAASGMSDVRVAPGDSIQMRVAPIVQKPTPVDTSHGGLSSHGEVRLETSHDGHPRPTSAVSSFTIKRGGTKQVEDYTSKLSGTFSQTYDNATKRTMGADVQGAGSHVMREVIGQRNTDIVMGTINGTTAAAGNISAIRNIMKLGKAAGTTTGPTNAPSGAPSMTGYQRY